MDDVGLGRTLRALRLRNHLSQAQVAARARISQTTWSRIERGHISGVPVGTLRQAFGAVDARLEIGASWRGGRVDRLSDERHAALVLTLVKVLQSLGWETDVEVTYSEFGERGSVDVLGLRQELGLALVVEVKTELASLEATLRHFDPKTRLAGKIVAERFGWRPKSIARVLVLEATMTNRRRVAALATVLERAFPVRSDAARAWLREPVGTCSALLFVSANHHRN